MYHQDNTLDRRVKGLCRSLVSPANPAVGVPALAGTRLDGTDFAAAILQSVNSGRPRLSASYVPKSLLLSIPSSLWPSKLDHQSILYPMQLETEYVGIQRINFLPTLPGIYVGFLAPPVRAGQFFGGWMTLAAPW